MTLGSGLKGSPGVPNHTPKVFSTMTSENLPTAAFVEKQTIRINGEVLIVGLSQAQADALIQFAKGRGIEGSGHNRISLSKNPLSEHERGHLSGKQFPAGSVEVYLGHTTQCYKPLFQALGIAV